MLNLFLAFITAFWTMFIWSISWWVGLLLRPILIFLWFNPLVVIWSVRVASIFWEIPTLIILQKSKKIDWKLVLFLIFPMFIWSFLSAVLLLSIDEKIINYLMWTFLILSWITLILKKDLWLEDKSLKPNFTLNLKSFFWTILISFFNTITWWLWVLFSSFFVYIYKKTYIQASALTKTSSYIWSWLSSLIFLYSWVIDFKLLISLIFWFLLGSYFWTKFSLKKWESWMKYLILTIIFISSIKLIFFK